MADFNRLNNLRMNGIRREGINTDNYEFKPLKDFVGARIMVDGFFFTTGKYGKQVVVIGNGYNINMPARAVEEFEGILADEELCNGIRAGELMLDKIEMKDTKNGRTVVWEYCNR